MYKQQSDIFHSISGLPDLPKFSNWYILKQS